MTAAIYKDDMGRIWVDRKLLGSKIAKAWADELARTPPGYYTIDSAFVCGQGSFDDGQIAGAAEMLARHAERQRLKR